MRTLLLAAVTLFFMACNPPAKKEAVEESKTEESVQYFGEKITIDDAMPIADFAQSFQEDSTFVKLTGTVNAVCQKKGCWMTLDLSNGETMRVTFKDYGFFVPKDLTGEVVIEGKALKKITPMEDLKHFAEDEGKSAEEIAQITEDEEQLVFEAIGVAIPTEKSL